MADLGPAAWPPEPIRTERLVLREPEVLCTQTANDRRCASRRSLGFTEVERLEEYNAEQWFGVWSSVTPSS
jgi:hypothetical protein